MKYLKAKSQKRFNLKNNQSWKADNRPSVAWLQAHTSRYDYHITILPYYHIHPFIVSTVGAVDTGQQPGWCRVVTGAAATGSTQQSCQRHVSSEPTPDPTTPQQQQPLPQHRPGCCGSLLTVQTSASVSPFPVCSDYFWCGYSGTFGGHQTRFFPPASRCGLGGKDGGSARACLSSISSWRSHVLLFFIG